MLLNELENLLKKYKALSDKMSELHDLGFDFYEGKFPLMSDMEFIFELTILSHYTQQGADWVNWFVYETNYGERKLEAYSPKCLFIRSQRGREAVADEHQDSGSKEPEAGESKERELSSAGPTSTDLESCVSFFESRRNCRDS